MKMIFTTLVALLVTTQSFATATRILDGAQITNGAATLTLPTTTDTILGAATTNTLTNKSISGSTNTLTAIPGSAISSGQIAVANGGTGLSSGTSGGILGYTASGTLASSAALTANAIVLGGGAGATPSALGSLGTTTTLLHGNAAGAPTYGAVALATDVSGQLPLANGGTGGTSQATAANAVLPSQGSNSGKYLTTDGTNVSWGTVSSGTPTITGTRASPSAIVAGTGIAFTGTVYSNTWFIQGSGGPVTVTANPQIAAGTNVGQALHLIGRSATNTVTLADGTGLSLNGTWVGGLDSVLTLEWDGTSWVETSRR